MRISDWSSDVCSSDLFGNRGVGQQQARAADLDQDAADVLDGIVLAGCVHACLEGQDGQRPASCSASSAGVATVEIGRASCREKSVSVRVDLGGRRIIKNTKNQLCTVHPQYTKTKQLSTSNKNKIQ